MLYHICVYSKSLVCSANLASVNQDVQVLHMNCVFQTVLRKHSTDAAALYVGSPTMSAVGAVDLIK